MVFSVTLDEENQLIVQSCEGELCVETFAELEKETDRLSKKLKAPDNIRILVDARKLPHGSPGTRRVGINPIKKTELHKIAFWGGKPIINIVLKFLAIAANAKHKVQTFKTEAEAREWLKA